jgi:hypothetical protein
MDAKLAVAQRRDEFVSAFNREDVSALRDLCEPDVVQLPPNQPPVVGADESFEWWTTGFTASRSRVKIVPRELHVYRDTAIGTRPSTGSTGLSRLCRFKAERRSSIVAIRSGYGGSRMVSGASGAPCGTAAMRWRRSGPAARPCSRTRIFQS